jgi:hypothetical protein
VTIGDEGADVTDDRARRALSAIAVITMASGLTQTVAPRAVLAPLKVEDSPATRQLFATIGMFMAIVGGLLFGALRSPAPAADVVLWTGAQKLGSAGAVAIGVRRSVFSPRALLVASFDFASGLLAIGYWRRLRRP